MEPVFIPHCQHGTNSCSGTCFGYRSTGSCPPLIVIAVLAAMAPLVGVSPTALAIVRAAGASR